MKLPRLVRTVGANQRGFTLVELMTALSIGMVVLLAAYAILDRSVSAADTVSDRVNTTQRGRLAMDQITRQLRSQVCLPTDSSGTSVDDTTTALLAADANTVTFYADLGGENSKPQKRRLSYAANKLTEEIWTATQTSPSFVFPTNPSSTRTLATDVVPVDVNGQPQAVFRFFAYNTSQPPSPDLALGTPLNTLNLGRTVRMNIVFRAQPERKRHDGVASTQEGSIFIRGSRASDFTTNPPEYGGPPLCT